MATKLQGSATILVHERRSLEGRLAALEGFVFRSGMVPLSRHPAWPAVLENGLSHRCLALEAVDEGTTTGYLGLVLVRTPWFGRFLVSLPYLNYGGVEADDEGVVGSLIDRAAGLADELDVRYLELRNRRVYDHPVLTQRLSTKINMRLSLASHPDGLWEQLPSKVRNQIRKARKSGLEVVWGGEPLLGEFYRVFCRNMRDLGTPVYGWGLFASILQAFPDRAEICVIRSGTRPVAAALVLHGMGVSEVPSASSLREYNNLCGNMLMYYSMMERSVLRGQREFDFGRSSPGSRTFDFKRQWGAHPEPSEWQYRVRSGEVGDLRPDNPRYGRMISMWRCLPVWVTRLIGPQIVRGIP
jgi:FemAB-related protein (PEP-CTERM system-associated)